ncbi:unnamed protein product [Linum trigynum]|uniref:Uncharacterized protein n=1 Tax=Linum trigynum TaxID=586398 RepID=A0AAV2ENF4_9ROSI
METIWRFFIIIIIIFFFAIFIRHYSVVVNWNNQTILDQVEQLVRVPAAKEEFNGRRVARIFPNDECLISRPY